MFHRILAGGQWETVFILFYRILAGGQWETLFHRILAGGAVGDRVYLVL